MPKIDPRDCVPIPQPRGLPIVGNINNIDPEFPMQSFMTMAEEYGECFSLTIYGRRRIFINTVELADEIFDEKRFQKIISAGLKQLHIGVRDGLFTAKPNSRDWGIAHRVLTPALGPLSLENMWDDMKDIASQLILKWARYGPKYKIDPGEDFTRLTLDTLALCTFDYRFNSFYTEETHPFVEAMMNFLEIAESRTRRPYMGAFYRAEDRKFDESVDYMRELAADLLKHRQENPSDAKDLLNFMLNGVDPKTGEKMNNQSIIDNMITFLVAGHETTSGTLSFLFYFMLKNPEAYRKAQTEVDEVLGNNVLKFTDQSKFPYITAMLRETLRLQPTAPVLGVGSIAKDGALIGGKYFAPYGTPVYGVLHTIQRDKAIFGEDAEEWKPERMLGEKFDKLPQNSWRSFGNGSRACIGKGFAFQEGIMIIITLLQFFNFSMEDPHYNLVIRNALTIKPKDFFIRATLREGWTATRVDRYLSGSIRGGGPSMKDMQWAVDKKKEKEMERRKSEQKGIPFTILYGSNSGTCEAFAHTLATDAEAHGFSAAKVATLDSHVRHMSTPEGPFVIITASYEGMPTDNATAFYDWLMHLKPEEKLHTSHAVFGAGHSDWRSTFHRVPVAMDERLAEHGSKRICEMGSADAAKGNMMAEFQKWEDNVLWPAMQKEFGGHDSDQVSAVMATVEGLAIEVSNKRASTLRADVSEAKVVAIRTLTNPGVPEKRHLEVQLPTNMAYRSGDYLAILPLNPPETVRRVMSRFGLPWDSMLNITARVGTTLPTGHPVSANDLFSAYLELSQPATERNVSMLIEAAKEESVKKSLNTLLDETAFTAEVTNKHVSLLDLLERYPTIELPLPAFVSAMIPMRVRQYSVSSSPLGNPTIAALTYGVLDEPSKTGSGRRHIGVASSYLSHLEPGDILHVSVRPSHHGFHLPANPETVPVILIGAGSGIAPFRGFVQERAAQIGAGRKLAQAHLYIGHRHPDMDDLYREELTWFESIGAVTTHRTFSRDPKASGGHKYVTDALRADKEKLAGLWSEGARVYVCGSRKIGEGVRDVMREVWEEFEDVRGAWEGDFEGWMEKCRNERYSTDVFD